MKKIIKAILFITLLMLLIGIVNAREVSQNTDTDTLSQELVVKDINTASNANAVPQDKELGADLRTDEKYEYNINESTTKTLNMNKDNDELKEDSEITNWSELAKAVDDAKNKTGQITIMLGNGIYQTNGTIIFNNPNATITINGNGQTIDGNHQRAFIIMKASSVVITNIKIKNCHSGNGGAIVNNGTLTVTQSEFTNNTAWKEREGGGAIENHETLTVIKSEFTNNAALGNYDEWGAIENYGTLTVTQSQFGKNRANHNGGAILNKKSMKITDSIFLNNQGNNGGALYNDRKTTTNIANSSFAFNTAKNPSTKYGEGGAIVIFFGKITITQSKFIINTATIGGAIMNWGGEMMKEEFLIIKDSLLANNEAEEQGGAILSHTGWNFVSGSNFTGNQAPEGAAIYATTFTNITDIYSLITMPVKIIKQPIYCQMSLNLLMETHINQPILHLKP